MKLPTELSVILIILLSCGQNFDGFFSHVFVTLFVSRVNVHLRTNRDIVKYFIKILIKQNFKCHVVCLHSIPLFFFLVSSSSFFFLLVFVLLLSSPTTTLILHSSFILIFFVPCPCNFVHP